jgi:hypothetical protein
VTGRRFPGVAGLPWTGPRGGAAGSLDDLAHAPPDRSGDAPGRVHVGPSGAGDRGSREGQDPRLAQASGIETPTRADLGSLLLVSEE